MNKMYKVVFNKALGRFVVASEKSKSRTKSSISKSVLGGVLVATVAMSSVPSLAANTLTTAVHDQLYGDASTVTISDGQLDINQQIENLDLGGGTDLNNSYNVIVGKDIVHNIPDSAMAASNIIGHANQATNSEKVNILGTLNVLNRASNTTVLGGENNLNGVGTGFIAGLRNNVTGHPTIDAQRINVVGSYNDLIYDPASSSVFFTGISVHGSFNKASRSDTAILGDHNNVRSERSSTIGFENKIGLNNNTKADGALVLGSYNTVNGENQTVIGGNLTVSGGANNSIVSTFGTEDYTAKVSSAAKKHGFNEIADAYSGLNKAMIDYKLGKITKQTYDAYVAAFEQAEQSLDYTAFQPYLAQENLTLTNTVAGWSNQTLAKIVNVKGDYNVDVGSNLTTTGNANTVLGKDMGVTGDNNAAIGSSVYLTGSKNTSALGHDLNVKGEQSTAIGGQLKLSGKLNSIFGFGSSATGSQNNALGNGLAIQGNKNALLGNNLAVVGQNNTSLGSDTTIDGKRNIAITQAYTKTETITQNYTGNPLFSRENFDPVSTMVMEIQLKALNEYVPNNGFYNFESMESFNEYISQVEAFLDTATPEQQHDFQTKFEEEYSTEINKTNERMYALLSEGKTESEIIDIFYAEYLAKFTDGHTTETEVLVRNSSIKGSDVVAMGSGVLVDANNAIAIGTNTTVTAQDGIAIGTNAESSHAGSVALGANSVATGETLGNDAFLIGGTAQAEINIGNRRITGLAAGANDFDAVNVAQLRNVDTKVEDITTSLGGINTLVQGHTTQIGEISTTINNMGTSFGDQIGEINNSIGGINTNISNLSTMIGDQIGVINTSITNLGNTIGDQIGEINTSIGAVNTSVTNLNNIVGGHTDDISNLTQNYNELNAVAVRYDDSDKGSLTLGGANGTVIHNVKAGTADTDAVNVGQLTKATDDLATAIGGDLSGINTSVTNLTNIVGDHTTQIGEINTNIITLGDTLGEQIGAVNTSVTNLNNIVGGHTDDISNLTQNYNELNAVAVRYDDSDKGSLTLGGANGTVIHNVKAGTADTDAVNVGQLTKATDDLATAIGGDLSGINTSVTNLTNIVGDHTTQIGDINTSIINMGTTIGDQIGEINTSIGGINTSVTNLTSIVGGHTGDINTLTQNYNALNAVAVRYDSADKARITLGGANGTVIGNVATGTADTDAVNVAQLTKATDDLATVIGGDLSGINTSVTNLTSIVGDHTTQIGDINTSIINMGTTIGDQIGEINTSIGGINTVIEGHTTQIGDINTTINNLGDSLGEQIGAVNTSVTNLTSIVGGHTGDINTLTQNYNALNAVAVRYDSADKARITLGGANGTVIGNVATGTADTDAVNVAQLTKATDDLATVIGGDLSGINTSVTNLTSIVGDHTTQIGDINTSIINMGTTIGDQIGEINTSIGGINTSVTNLTSIVGGHTGDINTLTQNYNALNAVAVRYDSADKARITLGGANGTVIGNVATGTADTDAVNVAQLTKATDDLATVIGGDLSGINTSVTNLTSIVGDHTTQIGDINTSIINMGTTIGDQIGEINTSIGGINTVIEGHTTQIGDINTTINNLGDSLGEQIGAVNTSVTNLTSIVGGHTGDINTLTQNYNALNAVAVRYDSADKARITLGGANGTVIGNVATGTADTDAVNVAQLTKATDDLATVIGGDLSGINTSVTNLTSIVGDHTTQIGDINTSIINMGTTIGDQIGEINTSIGGINTVIEGHTTQIGDINTTINNLGDSLGEQIGAVNTSVTNLTSIVGGHTGDINTLTQNYNALNAVAVRYDSADKASLTLGGANGTIIHNVAEGTADTDAVNVAQLTKATDDLATVIGGDLSGINTSVTNLTSIVGDHTTQIGDINTSIINMGTTIGDQIGEINTSIGGINTVIEGHTTQIGDINTSIINMGTTIGDQIGEINTSIGGINTSVTNLTSIVGGHTGDINTLTQNYNALNAVAVRYDSADKASLTLGGANGTIIHNVAEGTADTDAVNVKQLNKVAEDVATLVGGDLTQITTDVTNLTNNYNTLNAVAVRYDSADKARITLGGANGTVIGNVATGTADTDAVNVAQLTKATDDLATVIGGDLSGINTSVTNLTSIIGDHTTQIGEINTNIITLGDTLGEQIGAVNNSVTNLTNVVGGHTTDINTLTQNYNVLNAVAVRYDDANKASLTLGGANGTVIHNVAEGTADTDAVNVKQLTKATDDLAASIGGDITQITTDVTNLTTNYNTLNAVAVRYDDANKGSLTLGGANGTVIHNVAAGTADTDAVNVKQLTKATDDLATAIGGDLTEITTNVTNLSSTVGGLNNLVEGHTTQIGAINTNIGSINTSIGDLTNIFNGLNESAVRYSSNGGIVNYNMIELAGSNGTVIRNVAAGTQTTDAVNFGQLTALKNELTTRMDSISAGNINLDEVKELIREGDAATLDKAKQDATTKVNEATQASNEKAAELAKAAEDNANKYTDDAVVRAGNGGDSNKEYVDAQDKVTLDKAAELVQNSENKSTTYTDSRVTEALNASYKHTDTSIANLKKDSYAYTDLKATETLKQAQAYADKGDIATLQAAKDYTDQRINDLESSFYEASKENRSGIAAALAIGNLPQPVQGGQNMVSVGMGTFKGEQAIAVGFSTVTEDQRYIFKFGGSADSSNNMAGSASVGFMWK